MTVDELIDALSAFPRDLSVRIDSEVIYEIYEIVIYRDTPHDPEWVVIRT